MSRSPIESKPIEQPRWLVASRVSMAICVSLLFATDIAAKSPQQSQIDNLAAPYLVNDVVGGMTIGILHNGNAQTFGYGQLSANDQRRPDGKTMYEIGSVSKVFTGLLLADAVIEGHARLDQPVSELLPANVKMPSRGERAITLQDLSTHVSGLPRLPTNLRMTDPTNPYAAYKTMDLYAFLNEYQLPRSPGAKSEYSNLAVGLLGQLLATLADRSYEDLLEERICKPLQLVDTTIALDKAEQARLAPPHNADGQPDSNWDLPSLAGAGAIRSTIDDMLVFAAAWLDPDSVEISPAIELAWKLHQEPVEEKDFAMGLGWLIARDGQTRWHSGQTGGYHSVIFVNRQLKAAVVILTNTATGEVDVLAEQLMRMLGGENAQPRTFEKTLEVASEIVARYVGKFQLAPGAVLEITADKEKLFAQLTGQPKFRVFPRSETEWFYKVVEATLKFEVDEQGKCNSVTLLQNGMELESPRIE